MQNPSLQTKPTSRFRSKYEAAVAASLVKRGLDCKYEARSFGYIIRATYTPDFFLPNGVVVETKGHFSSDDRRKMLAVKSQYPLLDIRLCFQNAQVKLSKAPKSLAYWQWAERHGFLGVKATFPTTWFTDAIQTPAA